MGEKLGSIVEKLRIIDGIIDFARGDVQLSIMLLAAEKGRVIPDYASEQLQISRKSIIDAIQKLKKKKLLERGEGNVYLLTERGKRFADMLVDVLSKIPVRTTPRDYYIVNETVLLVGTSMKEWVSLDTIARKLGMHPSRLRRILEAHGKELFKFRSVFGMTQVALTYDGGQMYELLLESIKMGPLTAKTLALMTGTLDPREALRRFLLAYIVISILVFVELTSPIGVISGSAWAAASVYLAFLLYSKK